jgi:NAD(P)-dependent dehydrogenase (short-subunit alcohol dehydrogenase family)
MNIVITGASSGIGYATALKFSQNSDNTIFALSRNIAKLGKLVDAALQAGYPGKIIPVVYDIVQNNAVAPEKIIEDAGNIDILLNNAGLLVKKPFSDLTDDDWLMMFQTNLLGHVRIIRKIAPLMGKLNRGHIVNISSMGGIQGSVKFEGMSCYSSMKAALANLTESLAVELNEKNISVNCLAPGSVDTEMFRMCFPGFKAAVTAPEIAQFLADFCVNGHRYFNGKILPMAVSTP